MKNVTIKGVEFELEVDFDMDGRLERVLVFLPGSDQELSEVLDEKVLKEIDQHCYEHYEPEGPEDDPREDR